MEWPEITADTLRDELIRIHKQIWDYVIENGYKPDTPYNSNCVCCEFDDEFLLTKEYSSCGFCPLGSEFCGIGARGIYTKWLFAEGEEERIKVAKEIRDAEFKSEGWFEEVRRICHENKKDV